MSTLLRSLPCLLAWPFAAAAARLEVVATFPAPEAGQGVAVDADCFYAINNSAIGRYRKSDGERSGGWSGGKGSPIRHLNAGVVVAGRLFCAHSNYPSLPEEGSVEIWDAATMRPVDRHVFDKPPGSLTWVVPAEDGWLACFAHYKSNSDPALSRLIRYDAQWRALATWSFPPEVIAKFGRYSSSCGGIGPDGRLYVSGHDAKELHVLDLPAGGGVARFLETVSFASEGQAFAWDASRPGFLYSIQRRTKEVIVSRLVK